MGVQALTNTHNYETNSIYLSYTGDNMCYRYAILGYYCLQSYENILYYNNEYNFYWMRFVCDTCIQGIKNKLNV